ncbi:pentapeptide repeat-containing protein [Microbacterium deminutum]|uniref:Pentapeptide repeat-containing protein n=1 Tax=Microbacterium deminutum TaxID=344164 RepID=A0ABN2R9H9_9MICO
MTRREQGPAAPRVSAPDLPRELSDGGPPTRGAESFQVRWTTLEAVTDAAHSAIAECAFDGVTVDRLDVGGASLVDVELSGLRATALAGRSGRLRRVRFTGGRIGTLDLADAEADEVELRGIRIDYLSLAGARVEDLIVSGCTFGTLDMPQARLSRVAFHDSRADEVDTRGLRCEHVDLRGLEAVSYLDPAGLRGATLSPAQIEQLAPSLAAALGIRVEP